MRNAGITLDDDQITPVGRLIERVFGPFAVLAAVGVIGGTLGSWVIVLASMSGVMK
ncbi:MAG: hypothetical protein HY985_04295 [Magnetospirillum sp.]|nr:hypothetical protein [Magnetospirillum sp.]